MCSDAQLSSSASHISAVRSIGPSLFRWPTLPQIVHVLGAACKLSKSVHFKARQHITECLYFVVLQYTFQLLPTGSSRLGHSEISCAVAPQPVELRQQTLSRSQYQAMPNTMIETMPKQNGTHSPQFQPQASFNTKTCPCACSCAHAHAHARVRVRASASARA